MHSNMESSTINPNNSTINASREERQLTDMKLDNQIPVNRSKKICGDILIKLSYTVYLCMVNLGMLVTSEYLYDTIASESPYHENITRGRSACHPNMSKEIVQAKKDAQHEASQWTLYLSVTSALISAATVSILGSLSDRYGRRLLFISTNTGLLIKYLIMGLTSLLNWPMETLYAAFIIDGLSGSFVAMLVGACASAADSTSSYKKRFLQIAAVNMLSFSSHGVVTLCSGFVTDALDYYGSFFVIAGVSAVNFIFIFTMPDTRPDAPENQSLFSYLKTVFQFYYQKSGNNRRTIYILILLTFFLACMVTVASMSIETLYIVNEPFCMNNVEIGELTGITIILGSVLALPYLLLTQLCLPDALIAAIGTTIAIGGYMLEGFADYVSLLYVAYVMKTMAAILCPSSLRSMITKISPVHRQGAALSSLAISESFLFFIGSIIYNKIYQATLDIYDGIVYFVMAGILLVCVGLFLAIGWLMHKDKFLILSLERKPNETNSENLQ